MWFWLYKIVIIYAFAFVYCAMFNNEPMTKNANNYGPYTLSFQHYGDCKGPKSKNLTIVTTEITKELVGIVNLTFLVDAKIEEIKVQVHSVKENKKIFLWSYKFSEPCKHFAIAAMIRQQLNANNCLVKKGFYNTKVNYKEVMNSFLGTSFFYGSYNYKSVLTSKDGNIACFNSIQTFSKKIV